MSAASTEKFYVPVEVSKILKKRNYIPDYDGRHDIPVTEDGVVIYKTDAQFKELESSLLPMVPWQEAFRFLRERYKIHAYIKRDTYWQKWRFAFERDHPRGETTSAVYDTIDEARVALFQMIDQEELPKMFSRPDYYEYNFELTENEKLEGQKWLENIDAWHKKRREEILKKAEKPEM